MAILLKETHARPQIESSMYGSTPRGLYDNAYKIDPPKISMIGTPTRMRGGRVFDAAYYEKHKYDTNVHGGKLLRGARKYKSVPYTEGFMQQIPTVFKGGGFTLM